MSVRGLNLSQDDSFYNPTKGVSIQEGALTYTERQLPHGEKKPI